MVATVGRGGVRPVDAAVWRWMVADGTGVVAPLGLNLAAVGATGRCLTPTALMGCGATVPAPRLPLWPDVDRNSPDRAESGPGSASTASGSRPRAVRCASGSRRNGVWPRGSRCRGADSSPAAGRGLGLDAGTSGGPAGDTPALGIAVGVSEWCSPLGGGPLRLIPPAASVGDRCPGPVGVVLVAAAETGAAPETGAAAETGAEPGTCAEDERGAGEESGAGDEPGETDKTVDEAETVGAEGTRRMGPADSLRAAGSRY